MGWEDMHQLQQREMGKMGNEGIKATEEITGEAGTTREGKQKVKPQGGKYCQAAKYAMDAFLHAFRSHFRSEGCI